MKTAEKQYEKIGATKGCADHDHDLIQELDKRLDAVWRMDQYINNAEGKSQIREFWTQLKNQEQQNVNQLKDLVAKEVKEGCF